MRTLLRLTHAAAFLLAAMCATPVLAQAPPSVPPTEESRRAETQAAWAAAQAAATPGPASIALRDQARLALPDGMLFIPPAEATRLSRSMGNAPGPGMLGLVLTPREADEWIVYLTYVAEGFVKDDEARDLDADTILANLREGTEEANENRVARGFGALELTGWIQKPHYDAATHQLAWSLGVRDKGDAAGEQSVNFNTRTLGREGYISLNLVTGADAIAKDRAVAATLLDGLRFDPGKSYADFNASTDRVAGYGLAALIGVVAAKKLGLLAIVGVFLLKFAKIGALAVAGVGVVVAKLFRRKPTA